MNFVWNDTLKKEQDNLDDTREITGVWTYSRDNQVKQLFQFFKEFGKGDNLIFFQNIILF